MIQPSQAIRHSRARYIDRRRMRFSVKHLLVLTVFAAVNFAAMQFPATFVQAAIVIQISIDTATRVAIAISTVALAVSTALIVIRSKDRTFLVLAIHMCAWLTFVYDPSTRFFYLADAAAELISCFVAFGACSFIARQHKGIAPYGLILFWAVELSLVIRNLELRAWGFGWHVDWIR